MTQSPTSSQIPPNGTSNPPINPESLDWESRMAQLVGLEEKYQAPDNSPIQSDELHSAIDEEPQAVKTQQELSSNPFAKAALVGTGTLIMVMFAGIFLTQVMGGNTKKTQVQPLAPPVTPKPTAKPKVQQLEAEVEALKTKLALAEQAKDIQAAQQQLRRLRNPPRKPNVTQSPATRTQVPAPVKTPTPVRTVIREVRVPQPQVSAPFPPPQPIPFNNQPPTVAITPPSPPTPPNPLKEWSRLAKLGSYGQVSATQEPGVNNSNFASTPKREVEFTKPSARKPRSRTRTTPSVVSQRRRGKSTVIGTSAEGILVTAISGETTRSRIRSRRRRRNNDAESDNNVFVVRLTEPLKTQNNEIALPADTEILMTLNSFSQEGLAKLKATKVVFEENNKLIEKNVPADGLAIRGTNGKPLMGKRYRSRGSSNALKDAGLFVLGGVGKAAEIINRQTTETSTVNNTTTTTTEGNNNALAGILEGGAKSVVPQLTRRTQRAAARTRNTRTNIWFLPEGTKVEVFVNRRMQF